MNSKKIATIYDQISPGILSSKINCFSKGRSQEYYPEKKNKDWEFHWFVLA